MKMKFLKLSAGAAICCLVAQFANAQTVGMTNSSGVTTQTVSRSGNNSVNGSPGAFGVTGGGATTPANSTTVNTTTSTNNLVVTTNSTVTTTTSVGTAGGVSSANISSANQRNRMQSGLRERIRNLLANRNNRRNGNHRNNNLTARLINAGSISSGNGNASANVSVNGTSNDFSQNNSNQTGRVVFDLTFFEQSTNRGDKAIVAKNSVTDRDIIAALGGATGNDFSSGARLIVGSNDNSSNGIEPIEVQDGSNVVDVSSFFMVSNSDVQVSGRSSTGDFQNGNGSNELRNGQRETTFSILYVTFDANGVTNSVSNTNNVATGLSFNVNGFNVTSGAADSDAVNADVSGTGTDTNGAPAVIKGTITVNGKNNSSP